MKRLAIATVWVVALAQPASAQARAFASSDHALLSGPAMCGLSQRVSLNAELARDRSRSVELARESDYARASRDLDSARSDEASAPMVDRAASPAQNPADDSPIAWCATPDDPRCSSRDAGSLPDSSHAPTQLNSSAWVEIPSLRPREATSPPRCLPLGAARDGRLQRLERPPR